MELSKRGLEKERTPEELTAFVNQVITCGNENPNRSTDALLHNGLWKQFYEELFPLEKFMRKATFQESPTASLKLGNQPYDAVVRYSSEVEQFVEITCAGNGYDEKAIMTAYINNPNKEFFNILAKPEIPTSLKKNPEKVKITCDFMDVNILLAEKIESIVSAIRKKLQKKYSSNTILLVAFDDTPFSNNLKKGYDREIYQEFKTALHSDFQSGNNFEKLFLIGLSEYIFLEL